MRRFWGLAVAGAVAACGGASRSDVRKLGGILDVQPPVLDFGDVALGREQTHALVVQNDGIVPLSVGELAQFADAAFEVRGLPLTLGPGEKAKVMVRYRPPALGSHASTLQLVTDSTETDRADVGLRGHAVRGLAQLSGDAFDFGPVVVNETATQEFSLINNDGHAETSVAIAPPQGADSSAFKVTPPGEMPIAAEQSMRVRIDFHPDRLGDFKAIAQVTPCPTCSPRNVTLSGRGVERLLVASPSSIDFGEVRLAGRTTQPFSLTNISKSPITVQSSAVKGSQEMSVALMGGGALPKTLAAGETVNGIATFEPRNLGAEIAEADFAASDGGPAVVAMSGTGIGPVLEVKPKSLFLGPAAVGTTRPGNITVTNVGLDPKQVAPLVLTSVSLSDNDGSWTLQSGPGTVGEPGASMAISFSFAPRAAGLSQVTLVLESNDGMRPHVEVPIAAMGRVLLPCKLALSPGDPFDFGPTKLFTASVQGFELTNLTGDDCIVGEPVIISGAPEFRWPGGVAPAGRTLPPGGRMSVRLEFFAEKAQSYTGAVQFYLSNPSATMRTVGLEGSGDGSCFFISPATVDFGPTTLGCGIGNRNAYAINQCNHFIKVTGANTSGPPFSTSVALPFDVAPNTAVAIPIAYAPQSAGDDVGTLYVASTESPIARQAGITGGSQTSATILDQWDQSTPKVDLLIVIDNSGSMAEEQHALASNLDHLWNRIALANADFHIAVTTTGMEAYTTGWTQCPGGASGGEGGRFFPVDNSHPRLLTPQTPNVKQALFANTDVGLCHWKEQFTEPVIAALTDPLIHSTKAPGTPWPNDGNAGFLRDDARLALLAVSDTDDDGDLMNPPPVSELVQKLAAVKHGALDLVSFSGIVPLHSCPTVESIGTRYMDIARQLHGHLEDICNLDNFGTLLDNALGNLLAPLTSFPLSARPKDPTAIVVTVNGATVTSWSYDAAANRIVFPASDVPPPGSHITAKYEPSCN